MKTEESKTLIRWYMLGVIGGILMAAGDWLLGCIPLQGTDNGIFDRAYYLSGTYGLWRPVLIVGMGAVGAFLYYFMVKALNADMDAKYRKQSLSTSCAGYSPLRSRWRSISGQQPWRGSPHIWGRVSERRLPSQRSRPIRRICSSPFSPCISRWYWFSGSIS